MAAQAEAFKELLRETVDLLCGVGIRENMDRRMLDFVPGVSLINNRATAARKAAPLMHGDNEAADASMSAHHTITIFFMRAARPWPPSCTRC
eukprot:6190767-Pleurochrysis_carterae.AAC.5